MLLSTLLFSNLCVLFNSGGQKPPRIIVPTGISLTSFLLFQSKVTLCLNTIWIIEEITFSNNIELPCLQQAGRLKFRVAL